MSHFPLPPPDPSAPRGASPLPPPASIAAQARAATAELAMAARHGAIGAGTVLAYTCRINRALVTLAEYERTLDELTQEAMAEARARAAAAAAGQLIELRPRHLSTMLLPIRATEGGGE